MKIRNEEEICRALSFFIYSISSMFALQGIQMFLDLLEKVF